jgi:hypothetical protein
MAVFHASCNRRVPRLLSIRQTDFRHDSDLARAGVRHPGNVT